MIDDDFESVFKRMIKDLLETFGEVPDGSVSIRSWNGSIVSDPLEQQIEPNNDDPIIETIDLGESSLILIELQNETETPSVRVTGSNIIVQPGPERKEITVDVGFQIDLEKSNVSHRNGVIEISVAKAINEGNGSNDGFLKIE
jgi:hypothetical protein